MTKRQGFTLIEVLVACAVFVALLLLLLDAWAQSARATTQARHQAAALGIAREQMDYLVSLPFDTAVSTPTGTRTLSATVGGNAADGTYTWLISKTPVPGRTDAKSCQVVVSWWDGGQTHHVDLESLVCVGF